MAPRRVEFYTSFWEKIGDRESLTSSIVKATNIPAEALNGTALELYTVDERLSWARGRRTKRQEDFAYSLLGIFDVQMPLLYGEQRSKAMRRLLQEIAENERRTLSLLFRVVRFYWLDKIPRTYMHRIIDAIHELYNLGCFFLACCVVVAAQARVWPVENFYMKILLYLGAAPLVLKAIFKRCGRPPRWSVTAQTIRDINST